MEDLKEVQHAVLGIMKDIDKVCTENHIKYWLYAGTLIGAVRHNGFIPWDDDLDVAMLREDYERFLEVAPKCLGNRYFIQTWESDPGFALPLAKVRKNDTIYLESGSQYSNCHHGLFVDIFVYDNLPDGSLDLFLTKICMQLVFRINLIKGNNTPWIIGHEFDRKKWLKYLPFRVLSCFAPRSMTRKLYRWLQVKENGHKTKKVFDTCEPALTGKAMDANLFDHVVRYSFEDSSFYIPERYDELLRANYGDYMQLPPLEERLGHHGIIEVKL